jgi:hypothetical protein
MKFVGYLRQVFMNIDIVSSQTQMNISCSFERRTHILSELFFLDELVLGSRKKSWIIMFTIIAIL